MGLVGTQAGELLEGMSYEMHMHTPMCNHARLAARLKNTGD